ncbi:MAG: nucleoside triphosphate pyrophosphohydrolase [Bdellovibrionota bacterium]
MKASKSFSQLVEIMEILRSERGCPWDREQTHQSIAKYCIEEAYEVVDAIEKQDCNELKKELGDLLLQVVFHSQMAKESEFFSIEDVIKAINEKMIFRHPHVFGDVEVTSSAQVKENWEALKQQEKSSHSKRNHRMEGIPQSMPALLKAYRLGEKAATVGFDWDDSQGVREKVKEEWKEFEQAQGAKDQEEEFGDLLFAMAQWARHHGIDPERCLQKANQKFCTRFSLMEDELDRLSKTFSDLQSHQLEQLWDQIKEKEKSSIDQNPTK